VSAPEQTADQFPIRVAMEARDLAAAVAAFAPDAVVRSPFTDGVAFTGTEQVRTILSVVLEVFPDLHYTGHVRDGERGALLARATAAGRRVDMVDVYELNGEGKIRELTVFFRPLPGTTAALRLIGGALGARKSSARGRLIGVLAAPMGAMSALGDRVASALVRPVL
jgi:SnoaL-like domain